MNVNATTLQTHRPAPATHGINSEAGDAGTLSESDSDRARLGAALESRWTRKLDEVIALSKAINDPAPTTEDELAAAAVLPPQRLRSRIDRAYEQLADIEDAIARTRIGAYE